MHFLGRLAFFCTLKTSPIGWTIPFFRACGATFFSDLGGMVVECWRAKGEEAVKVVLW